MLNQKHYEVMKKIKDGATVWGYAEAVLIREVQAHDSELVIIIPLKDLEKITGERYDGAGKLPYFGAILTDKGREFLKKHERSRKANAAEDR